MRELAIRLNSQGGLLIGSNFSENLTAPNNNRQVSPVAESLQELFNTLPQTGRVRWIGLRPERKAPIISVISVEAIAGKGLTGDRYNSKNGKRQVTLIQGEHLTAMASLLGREQIEPELLRRNIVVTGINLVALKDKQFRIGTALLEYTGLCHPCSAMEATFGPGGYNAVRGHGGITARIINSGTIALGDSVEMENVLQVQTAKEDLEQA